MILEEYDNCRTAVLNPDTFNEKIKDCPECCVGFFSNSVIEEIKKNFKTREISSFAICSGHVPFYEVDFNGNKIAIFHAPIGAPACVGMFEDVIEKGIKKLLLVGSCGCLDTSLEEYSLIVPTSSIRDEGTSYHYLPASDEVEIDKEIVRKITNVLNDLGVKYTTGKNWTTDAIYRETAKKVKERKAQGAITVDMECSAMCAVAKFRNIAFGQIFYAADSLELDNYQPRCINDQNVSKKYKIVPIAFECVKNM